MEIFLRGVLPRILPDEYTLDVNCRIVTYNGKQDLKKRIPIVLRSYRHRIEPTKFIVLHDQDSADCVRLKAQLISIIESHISGFDFLVRIVCRELENWYLGDMNAIEAVYPESNASRMIQKSKFRNPDNVHGSDEMKRLSINFAKMDGARRLSELIDIERNTSPSFQNFRKGIGFLTGS